MLVVKSKDKELVVACVGFYVLEPRSDYNRKYSIQGIMATTGKDVELGQYDKKKVYEVFDQLHDALANKSSFNMP